MFLRCHSMKSIIVKVTTRTELFYFFSSLVFRVDILSYMATVYGFGYLYPRIILIHINRTPECFISHEFLNVFLHLVGYRSLFFLLLATFHSKHLSFEFNTVQPDVYCCESSFVEKNKWCLAIPLETNNWSTLPTCHGSTTSSHLSLIIYFHHRINNQYNRLHNLWL